MKYERDFSFEEPKENDPKDNLIEKIIRTIKESAEEIVKLFSADKTEE